MSKFDWSINDIDLSEKLLVIPTIDVVVFPKMVVPLLVVDKNVITALTDPNNKIEHAVLVASKVGGKDASSRRITKNDLYSVGTACRIIRNITLLDGTLKIVVQGCSRVRLGEVEDSGSMLITSSINYEFVAEDDCKKQIDTFVKGILSMLESYSSSGSTTFGADFQFIISQIHDPERLVDFIVTNTSLDIQSAQKLLEKNNLADLLEATKLHFKGFLEKSAIKEDVKVSTRNSINKSQREYFLREQLRTIKKELGEQEDSENEDLKQSIEEVNMSQEAREEARRQMRRLDRMSPDSLEAVVIRNHLEWLVNMPWNVFINSDSVDIKKAKEVLDAEHYGLGLVKDKILDYLSVKYFKSKYNAQILCLAGSPGVGKTSIGHSIAKSMGKKFAHISMGGVHDESEVRGHRRTYVGALPGRIIQSIRKAKSCNPVLMVDEIDKIGSSGRGDPASALLEVLDPKQNNAFYDNYLGITFDISNVMFIATCNDVSAIPGPLRDRMEIIQIPGYTTKEKSIIAKQYLLPRLIKNMGLEEQGIEMDDDTIHNVITGYTRESGVRELERVLAKLCSKFARSIVECGEKVTFSKDNLSSYLGSKRTRDEACDFTDKIGVANGLAWTSYGGELLQVEAILMPGSGKLTLTGQLGDVMKESAQAAVSYVRSKAKEYNIDEKMFSGYDIHVHMPAGAIPKDGPSAGVTVLSSILSAFTQRPINSQCAMTGELNLQGLVLPIGGLKEKILAAQQHGFKQVFIPESNRKDVEEEGSLLNLTGIELYFVKNVDELLSKVLLQADVLLQKSEG